MVSFQPAMQVHDDLAALFSRNLSFNPELQAPQTLPLKLADLEPKQLPNDPSPEPSPSPITYSISAHYTHSAHITRQIAQTLEQKSGQEAPRRSSEPLQSDQAAFEAVFLQNGINPSLFSSSQLQLYRISDDAQRRRLLEIWCAAPPTNNQDNPSLSWTTTTLEQEERWARLRYEQIISAQPHQDMTMSLDGTQVQSPDSRWLSSSQGAEPYMMSGYEELMRREQEREAAQRSKESFSPYGSSVGQRYSHATDPVYRDTTSEWSAQQQMQMENQYGAFQQNQSGPAGNSEAMDIL